MKNFRLLPVLTILWTVLLSSACAQSDTEVIKVLSVETFAEKMAANDQVQLIDVRTPGEVQGGIIPGATHMDFRSAAFSSQLSEIDVKKPVFVYCASGIRSYKAAQMLEKMGAKEVYDLQNGIRAWAAAGKKLVKP